MLDTQIVIDNHSTDGTGINGKIFKVYGNINCSK